jgi:acyl-coenzyme A thioesterase PaaI-like protein
MRLSRFHAACHPGCVACRTIEEGGLGLHFQEQDGTTVIARFDGDPSYQGHPDRLHGGIIAVLMDAAVTHCLFAREIRAYTARLELRYRHPLELGIQAEVRASLVRSRPPWHCLRAEVAQRGRTCASAVATFLGEREDHAPLPEPGAVPHE